MTSTLSLLLYLAKKGALTQKVALITGNVANELGSSQQTMSRKLVELQEQKLITREVSPRGVQVQCTKKGEDYLREVYANLQDVFGDAKTTVQGEVVSGLGEGAYYMSLPQYREKFKSLLSIDPYPGTLNVNVSTIDFQRITSRKQKIVVSGFSTKQRSYGGLVAYLVKVNGEEAAIIIPDRTSHKETIEIISKTYFRKAFNLKDKDKVVIE